MSNSLIERVNQAIDIVELASEYVKLEKKGKNLMGLCPFHDENTPSFSVSSEKNLAYCMSCHKGGAPITFYQQINNITFKEALYEMAKRAGLDDELSKPEVHKHENVFAMFKDAANFYHFNLLNSTSGKEVLQYLNDRGIDFESIKHFNIGLSPTYGNTLYQVLRDKNYSTSDMIKYGLVKQNDDGTYYDLFSNRLMFPIKNDNNKVVAFSGRILNNAKTAKYINSPESDVFIKGHTIYHLSDARLLMNNNMPIIISEGFFDVIKIFQSGFKNVVATMGTSFTNQHINNLKKLSKDFIIAFDGDSAGMLASLQASIQLLKMKTYPKIIRFPNKLDPDDFISEYGDDAFLDLVENKSLNAYDFIYNYTKSKYNFESLVDKQKFKEEMIKLINIFDETAKQHYLIKLSTDLEIDVLTISKETTFTKTPVLKQVDKNSITELKNRYENAEIEILSCMVRDRDLAYFIIERLEQVDYVNIKVPLIRNKIINFYDNNEIFDISSEQLEFTDEELKFIMNNVYGHLHFQNNIMSSQSEISLLINTIKDAHLIRKLEQNMVDLEKSNGDLNDVIRLRNERLATLKLLQKIGGEK